MCQCIARLVGPSSCDRYIPMLWLDGFDSWRSSAWMVCMPEKVMYRPWKRRAHSSAEIPKPTAAGSPSSGQHLMIGRRRRSTSSRSVRSTTSWHGPRRTVFGGCGESGANSQLGPGLAQRSRGHRFDERADAFGDRFQAAPPPGSDRPVRGPAPSGQYEPKRLIARGKSRPSTFSNRTGRAAEPAALRVEALGPGAGNRVGLGASRSAISVTSRRGYRTRPGRGPRRIRAAR